MRITDDRVFPGSKSKKNRNRSYTTEELFYPDHFKNPDSIFHPVYSWVWNSPISKPRIKAQIDNMNSMGIRSLYIIPEPPEFRPTSMVTKMSPPYLSDDFFLLVQYAAACAKEKGMVVWLYDEGGWPSGGACGQVLQGNPDFASEIIVEQEVSVKQGDTYIAAPGALASCTDQYEQISSGTTVETDCTILEYTLAKRPGHLPCLLKEKAVDKFLDITYQRYDRFLGSDFGQTIYAVFTDEAILAYPYTVLDREDFKKQTGYVFTDWLPAIFHDNVFGEEGERFRIAYFDYTSRLFGKTYMKKLSDWCSEHNLLLAGHMDGDHILTDYCRNVGSLPEQLRYMDIPGVDVIVNQIYPGAHKDYLFPRMASSAANQTGKYRALTESFAVYGAGLTFQTMRYVIGVQAIRGINTINIMSLSSGNSDGFLCHQFRPNFMLPSPTTRFMPLFHRYLSRISYISSVGKPCRRTALYLPLRDLWSGHPGYQTVIDSFYAIGRYLDESLIDFDIIDDSFILSSVIRDGKMSGGLAEYAHIYIPTCKYLPPAVQNRLADFTTQGGAVYAASSDMICNTHSLTENRTIQTALTCTGNHSGLRASHRKDSNGTDIYLLFNEDTETFCGTVDFCPDSEQHCYELDLQEGCLYAMDRKTTLVLYCGMKCFIAAKEDYPVKERAGEYAKELLCEISVFKGAICEQFSIDSDFCPSLSSCQKHLGTISVGEWDCCVGRDFSGGVTYTSTFQLEHADKDLIIELGRICYCCEISVNHAFTASLLAAPYTVLIPACCLRRGRNELALTVYNTAANAYAFLDYSALPDPIKGTYHSRTLEYERLSLHGGVLDPVKIYRKS